MVIRRIIILFIIICFNLSVLYADEITEGNIQLVVNEKTGGFSLYYRANPQVKRFEALFHTEQAASFASVYIDGSTYRLGDRIFKTRFEKQNDYPSFIYESSFVTVTQIFSPVTTVSSSAINGIKITFIIQNTGDKDYSVGLRFLLDTDLGEGIGRTPFITSNLSITNERFIDNAAEEKYWISKNNKASIMGSIINPVDRSQKAPDSVYFANWKRFFNAPWQIGFSQGRSFGGDSAVCYYYEPAPLRQGESFTYNIFLTTEDTNWYNMTPGIAGGITGQLTETVNAENTMLENTIAAAEEPLAFTVKNETIIEEGLFVLFEMQELLNQFINGEIELNEQNLNEIESAINKYR